MTKKELIEALSNFSDDTIIVVPNNYNDGMDGVKCLLKAFVKEVKYKTEYMGHYEEVLDGQLVCFISPEYEVG